MKDIRLVATDLDGTLVDDGQIHPVDREILLDVLEKGVPVIPVTTRMRYSSSEILKGVPLADTPIVCMNGARIVGPGWNDHDNFEDWFERNIEIDIAEDISGFADEQGLELTTIFSEKKFWKRRRDQSKGISVEDPVAHVVENNREALREGEPISFMAHDENNGLDGIQRLERYAEDNFGDRLTLHRHHRSGNWLALTIYPEGTDKVNALRMVCDELGIPLDEVLAVGDDEVDERMLEEAGVGVAMGNSPDHVKKVADDIAPNCIEQGFGWTMRKYIL